MHLAVHNLPCRHGSVGERLAPPEKNRYTVPDLEERGRSHGPLYRLRFNTQLTGIDSEAVLGAPTFDELWPRIEPLLSSGVLAAHNAAFDMSVLKKCLRGYGIQWQPRVKGLCTVTMGRRLLPGVSHRLNDLCTYYGIDLAHHRADSDSLACARILIRYMESGADPARYFRTYVME